MGWEYDLLKGARTGDASLCQSALAMAGADVNYQTPGTMHPMDTALHIALRNNRKDVVIYLLSKGADIGIANEDGETPVEIAYDLDIYEWFMDHVQSGETDSVKKNNENAEILRMLQIPEQEEEHQRALEAFEQQLQFNEDHPSSLSAASSSPSSSSVQPPASSSSSSSSSSTPQQEYGDYQDFELYAQPDQGYPEYQYGGRYGSYGYDNYGYYDPYTQNYPPLSQNSGGRPRGGYHGHSPSYHHPNMTYTRPQQQQQQQHHSNHQSHQSHHSQQSHHPHHQGNHATSSYPRHQQGGYYYPPQAAPYFYPYGQQGYSQETWDEQPLVPQFQNMSLNVAKKEGGQQGEAPQQRVTDSWEEVDDQSQAANKK